MANYKKKVDKNQAEIVKELRECGYSVETDKDDILVGNHGKTLWIEIKDGSPFRKDGKLKKYFIKDSQYKILWNYRGQYNICWNIDLINNLFYMTHNNTILDFTNPMMSGLSNGYFRNNYKILLTPSELKRLRDENIIQDGVKSNFQKWGEGILDESI